MESCNIYSIHILEKIPSYYYAEATVSQELEKINIAEGIAISSITEDEEDYSQYIPRGYYEGDEQLEKRCYGINALPKFIAFSIFR